MSNAYITSTDVKATLILDGTAFADPDVDRAVDAANACIDELFGRTFVADASPSSRYYNVRPRSREVIEIHDLTRLTAITVAYDAARDGTFSQALTENVDYQFEPLNAELDGRPFGQIRSRKGAFPIGPRVLKVTGTHGWPSSTAPPQVVAFAEVVAVKLLERIRQAPFGVVTAGADMGVAMRIAKNDPDWPTLSAGLQKGVLVS